MKDRDGNEWVLVPVKATDAMVRAAMSAVNGALLYRWAQSVTDAIIAAAPQFVACEVNDAMAQRIAETVFNALGDGRVCANDGRQMIAAVRSELGPALGLVEIREPSDDECRNIWREAKANEGDGSKVCAGRAMFDSVRAVMWPKEGL